MKNMTFFAGIPVMVLVFILTVVGCASGPAFGEPTIIQGMINNVAQLIPLEVAGRGITFSFEGDYWRGRITGVPGISAIAGEAKFEETPDGIVITLNQSWVYANTGKTVPFTGEPVGKWQKTPGPEIVLIYNEGPPATLSVFSEE